jgi:hypothetical protein
MRARAALALFVLLGILHTWPLMSAPWRQSLNFNADAEYNAWAIAWILRTLPTDPANLFEANIFAPEPATLAYSHPIIVPALMAAPVKWLGGSPVLMFNVSMLLGLTLTAWATWFVVRRWTGSSGAGLVAGALAGFNVHLLTRLPHITAAHAWGLPLTLYFADRVVRRPNGRDALALTLVVAATAATSLYWLALCGIIVAATALVGGLRPRATLTAGGASILGLVLVAPLLVPYVDLATGGVTRPLEMVADFSATPAGYLTSTSRLHAGWTAPFFRDDVNVFFAGFTALGLAVVGAWCARTDRACRRQVGVLIVIAGIGSLLSLGPATAIYRWLYEWLPPLQGLRAAARFGFLYLTAIAFAAGFGVAFLQRRLVSRRAGAAVAAVALTLVTIEALHAPIRTEPFAGIPAIYSLLADTDEPVSLVEVPFYPPEGVHFNGEYVLNSTAHWQPLMNGTSGVTPMSYRRRVDAFWYFPEERAIQAIKDEGATHVMVHLEKFEHEAPLVEDALRERRDLWLIATDRDGHRLYEIRDP